MLEDDDYGYLRAHGYEKGYMEGYFQGKCEARIEIYRHSESEKETREKIMALFGKGEFEELRRFHEKYRNLSSEKMAERMLQESEFLPVM